MISVGKCQAFQLHQYIFFVSLSIILPRIIFCVGKSRKSFGTFELKENEKVVQSLLAVFILTGRAGEDCLMLGKFDNIHVEGKCPLILFQIRKFSIQFHMKRIIANWKIKFNCLVEIFYPKLRLRICLEVLN